MALMRRRQYGIAHLGFPIFKHRWSNCALRAIKVRNSEAYIRVYAALLHILSIPPMLRHYTQRLRAGLCAPVSCAWGVRSGGGDALFFSSSLAVLAKESGSKAVAWFGNEQW